MEVVTEHRKELTHTYKLTRAVPHLPPAYLWQGSLLSTLQVPKYQSLSLLRPFLFSLLTLGTSAPTACSQDALELPTPGNCQEGLSDHMSIRYDVLSTVYSATQWDMRHATLLSLSVTYEQH